MFDIGFPELLIVSVVALLVLGPERLPEALRTLGLWFGRMRRSFSAVKTEIEREIGMDEVRRQLHNEAILEEMRALETEVGNISIEDRGSEERGSEDRGEKGSSTFTKTDPAAEPDVDETADIVNEPHPDLKKDHGEEPASPSVK